MDLNCKKSDYSKVNFFAEKSNKIRNKSEENIFYIYGDIMDNGSDLFESDVTPIKITEFLKKAGGDDVTIKISSYGGSIYAGINIYNQLKDYKGNVKTQNLGIAASAASLVLCGGKEIEVFDSSITMIHNATVMVYGNVAAFTKAINLLKKSEELAVNIYKSVSSKSGIDFNKLMDEETWITGVKISDYFNFKTVTPGINNNEIDNILIKNSQTRLLEIKNKFNNILIG
jgi:ATP-dependent protease ClpP protease subunit